MGSRGKREFSCLQLTRSWSFSGDQCNSCSSKHKVIDNWMRLEDLSNQDSQGLPFCWADH